MALCALECVVQQLSAGRGEKYKCLRYADFSDKTPLSHGGEKGTLRPWRNKNTAQNASELSSTTHFYVGKKKLHLHYST